MNTEDEIDHLDLHVKKEYKCPECGSTHLLDIDVDGEVEVTVY